jgi:exopolysaccharide production protein ExoZ
VASKNTNLRNVQGLRGIAALIVVFAHVSGPLDIEGRYFGHSWISWTNLPANTGVDLFFVISGLIMTLTTWRSFDVPGSARRFLWRRLTRVYPLYWLITTPILLLFLVSPSSVSFDDGSHPSILASSLLLPQNGRMPLLVAWTLVYEMYFYILFAVAMLLGRRWFGWVIGAWSLLTVTLHLVLGATGNPYLHLVSSPLSLEFVFGVVIGYAVVRGWLLWPKAVLTVGIGAAAGLLTYLGSSGLKYFPSETFRVLGPGLVMALVVYGAVGLERRHGAIVPGFLQRWGDSSYSLYLIHVPALTALRTVMTKWVPPNPVVHAITIALIPVYLILVSRICYRWVEQPLQRFFRRARTVQRQTPAGLARSGLQPTRPPVHPDGEIGHAAEMTPQRGNWLHRLRDRRWSVQE